MSESADIESAAAADDAYLWLEDLRSEAALDWVRERNEATLAELSGERFEPMRAEALEVADSSDRLPSVKRRGEYLYNFWRDAEHPRGQWRRTTMEEFRKDAPEWDVVVDVDALAAAEGENWVWSGSDVIEPEYTRALITMSRGGSDAGVIREFDMTTREFVANGFNLPEGRSEISWVDEDTVLVGTDFGEGSMSAAGMPLVSKRWRRATPLEDAETVFTGSPTDLVAGAAVDRRTQPPRMMFIRQIDNNNRELLLEHNGKPVRVDVPSDAPVSPHQQWLVIPLPSGWVRGDTTYAPGTFLVADIDEFLAGTADLQILHEPDGRKFLIAAHWTKDFLVATSYQDAAARLEVITPGTWERKPLPGVPDNTDTGIHAVDEDSNEIFLVASGFDKPARMLHGYAGGEPVQEIKSAPERFDASDLVVNQHFATSADGTSIPYFIVAHRDSTGPVPTLLGGYGGFAQSMRPGYLGVSGRLWLARGGAYVMPNTRGGMEYGPEWYLQTKREGRHKVAEDFAAVAGDLIERGVTTAPQLGGTGASAGGLLMGVMLTQYPELFGALVCRQPLLDMRRFPKLSAGAAFVAEYGDPDDPADWEFIKQYSPYQNISTDAAYPPILITTSTNDDRAHPGHARKMAAALKSAGHRVLFYENTEGGHAGVSNNAQAAFESAMMYEFLHSTLGP